MFLNSRSSLSPPLFAVAFDFETFGNCGSLLLVSAPPVDRDDPPLPHIVVGRSERSNLLLALLLFFLAGNVPQNTG